MSHLSEADAAKSLRGGKSSDALEVKLWLRSVFAVA